MNVMKNIKEQYHFIPSSCWILLVFSLIEAVGGGLVYYIAYFFKVVSSYNMIQIGQLGFSIGLGALAGSISGAGITDKVEPKKLLLLSFVMVGLCYFFIAKKMSFLINIPIVFLLGLFSNLFMNTNTLMLLKLSPSESSNSRVVQNIRMVFENSGNGIAMLLIMFCSASYFTEIFDGLGSIFLLLAIIAFKVVVPVGIEKEKQSDISKTCSEKKETNLPQFITTIISVFLIGLVFGIQKITYPLAMHSYFVSTVIIGLIFAIDPFFIAFFSLRFNRLFKNISPSLTMAFGAVMMSIGTFCLGLSHSIPSIICSTIIFLVGELLFMPASCVLCFESISSSKEGFAINLRKGVFTLGTMLGVFGAGVVLEHYSFLASWSISSLCSLSVFCILAFGSRQDLLVSIKRYGNTA